MGFVKSIFKLFLAIFRRLLKGVLKFIKKFWVVILIAAIIFFAPYLLTILPAGTPAFITAGLQTVATSLTPTLVSTLSSAGGFISSTASAAWTGFTNLSLGTQLAVASGVAAAIAPEEFGEVVDEGIALTGQVIGAVTSAVLSNGGLGIALALGAAYLLTRSSPSEESTIDLTSGGLQNAQAS